MAVVYWIHHPDHTDMFSQGYVGVSNRIDSRFEEHKVRPVNPHLKHAIKKYGWDSLVKKVLIIADEAYCLAMEAKLRAEDAIGWNIVKGGGKPPVAIGNKYRLGIPGWSKGKKLSAEHCKNLSESHKGNAPWNKGKVGVQTPWNKGTKGVMVPWNKGSTMTEKAKKHYKVLATCLACRKTGKIAGMRRWHFENCAGQRNYESRVTVDGKRFSIGTFATKEEAAKARDDFYLRNKTWQAA